MSYSTGGLNSSQPDGARAAWLHGDWQAVATVSSEDLATRKDRQELAAFTASAYQQLGDMSAAIRFYRLAMEWGCSGARMQQILMSNALFSLGTAALLVGRDEMATDRFRQSAALAAPGTDPEKLAGIRHDSAREQIRRRRQQHLQALQIDQPRVLQRLAGECLNATDFHEKVAEIIRSHGIAGELSIEFFLEVSSQLAARRDRISALHFLNRARELVPPASRDQSARLVQRYIAIKAPEEAVPIVVNNGLRAFIEAGRLEDDDAAVISNQFDWRWKGVGVFEHGHGLLLAYMDRHIQDYAAQHPDRTLVLLEIGTTRENIGGQGSTAKLWRFCRQNALRFITVDMDPQNTAEAQKVCAKNGGEWQAITMKGEDFLRQYEGPLDFVFLDAYDFDHGQHSELRQQRYEKYLGQRIDDRACHEMHLDCARSLVDKLTPGGIVCIDDAWLEDGSWRGKGTLAVPHLLASGFELTAIDRRAVLLIKGRDAGESGT